jgi:hypothetical protein
MDVYRLRFAVPNNAVNIVRLRLDASKHTHLTDDAVRRSVDSAVAEAYDLGHYERVRDQGADAYVVDLKDTFADGLYALVKENSSRRRGDQDLCIVTLLTANAVNTAKTTGRWEYSGSAGAKIVALKDKLGTVSVAEASVEEVEEDVKDDPLLKGLPEAVLSWYDEDDVVRRESGSKEKMVSRYGELIEEGCPKECIALFICKGWEEKRPKLKVEVTLE